MKKLLMCLFLVGCISTESKTTITNQAARLDREITNSFVKGLK